MEEAGLAADVFVKTENLGEECYFPDRKSGIVGSRGVPVDDDGLHGDSGLLNMLAEVASATLHNDSLARRTRNPRGRPVSKPPLEKESLVIETAGDSNRMTLAQLQLLTEKQLVDLFSLLDSDEIRRTFTYTCCLLQRCLYAASSFGSEMKARQEMQKHLSQHVRDLMRKARETPEFSFSAAPVTNKTKKLVPAVKETKQPAAAAAAPAIPAAKAPKEKVKIKLAPIKKVQAPKGKGKPAKAAPSRKDSPQKPAQAVTSRKVKEEAAPAKKVATKKRKSNAEDGLDGAGESCVEETTVKEKWLKLYHDKYRAVDEARFRAIQGDLSAESEPEQDLGAVAEEVVVTSEDPIASSSSSLPDHDYNIYRFMKRTTVSTAPTADALDARNQDEQMEAVAQSVAAAAQEKEKLKRKKTNTSGATGVPLHSFMLEETTKQGKVVVKNKPTEPLPCVGSEVVVGYNPSEFYLMKSSELPVIEDFRHHKTSTSTAAAVAGGAGTQQQFTFVCMTEDGELIEETVHDQEIFLEDEEQLLEQVAAQATIHDDDDGDKDMVEISRKRAKIKPKFVSQSAGERELALQYISELKQQRGSGVDALHCKICTPVRTFTAPTTLLSHYRSHAGIKPYECRRCGAVFTRQHSLNYHMLIHANLSRFTCPDCHRQFRHPSHYKEHRRRHTGEAPYECSDCMQRFRTRNSYKRHLMTRHGKLLTSTGGLIILPEDEFNKVRCKPRPMRARSSDDSSSAAAAAHISTVVVGGGVDGADKASSSGGSNDAPVAKAKGAANKEAADGSGNFEQQRQEDLIRLLYQRLTSPNEHSSAESSEESRPGASPTPVLMASELGEDAVVEEVVVESAAAAAVVVESIPLSQDEQVVEEQCQVVTDDNWGSSFISLTVDGQNNVIFLDESASAMDSGVVVDEKAVVVETTSNAAPAVASGAATVAVVGGGPAKKVPSSRARRAGAVSPAANDVDLLSFVHNAGVMVQHILDIQSDNSTP